MAESPTYNDTIAAIATPPGRGGVGIVRISGNAAPQIAQQLLGMLKTPRHVQLSIFTDAQGEQIDQGLALYFPAPHSFTGEDVIEISCHGSPVALAEVLRLLISRGAVPAEPGEFSLRAFLNHRIDLAQAEAINDLIHSRSAYQARLAARQLRGDWR